MGEDCIHEGVEMKDIMSPSDVSVLIVFQEYLIITSCQINVCYIK